MILIESLNISQEIKDYSISRFGKKMEVRKSVVTDVSAELTLKISGEHMDALGGIIGGVARETGEILGSDLMALFGIKGADDKVDIKFNRSIDI
jgi:hypothetical protein